MARRIVGDRGMWYGPRGHDHVGRGALTWTRRAGPESFTIAMRTKITTIRTCDGITFACGSRAHHRLPVLYLRHQRFEIPLHLVNSPGESLGEIEVLGVLGKHEHKWEPSTLR